MNDYFSFPILENPSNGWRLWHWKRFLLLPGSRSSRSRDIHSTGDSSAQDSCEARAMASRLLFPWCSLDEQKIPNLVMLI